MPVLDISRCEMRPINWETAANMVRTYHYAHRVPSITIPLGMYIDDILAGCITLSTMFTNISSSVCGSTYKENVLELSRLFVHDWAGQNSESWLIGQMFGWLRRERKDILILLSYADSSMQHIGYVYQATNWLYTGTSEGSTEFVFNGRVISSRNQAYRKNSRREGGRDGGLLEMEKLEALYPGIEKIRTSPKHRYVYFLGSKKQRKELRKALRWPVLPYPKSGKTGSRNPR